MCRPSHNACDEVHSAGESTVQESMLLGVGERNLLIGKLILKDGSVLAVLRDQSDFFLLTCVRIWRESFEV